MAGYQPPVDIGELGPHWQPFIDRLHITPGLVDYVGYVGLRAELANPGSGLAAETLALERAEAVQAASRQTYVVRIAPGIYVSAQAA